MRLGIRLWPQGRRPDISAWTSGRIGGVAQRFFSWQGLGAALLGVMLAKWSWVLLAPAGPAMPAAALEATGDAGRLFGTASVADAAAQAPIGNIKLIGVFAHPTKGFAVLQSDDKQIGVALGEEVKPGVRLVETRSDHVVLEQGGVRQRVDITGAAPSGGAPAGTSGPAIAPTAPGTAPSATSADRAPGLTSPAGTPPAGQIDALQHQLDAAENLPPEQREAARRQLERMRGPH